MRTRSSSNLPVESPPNPSNSNPKRSNRRRSKQPFILEESPIDTMVDQRTMAELLRAPTEGYTVAIMVPLILAEQFELKHSLINMMTSDQFAFVKAVEEICVTCSGAHPYYQCLAASGNTFLELKDNIQGYVAAAAVNYNQEKIKRVNEVNIKAMQTQINNVKNELRNEMKNSIQAFMSNQTNELKNIMASFFQMNTAFTLGSESLPNNTIANPKGELKAITTRSGIVLDGPSVSIPPPFINQEEDKRVKETLTDQDLAEYTIKVPPPLVQKPKPPSQRNFIVHQRDPLHPNIPYPSRMLKQKQQEKDEKNFKALLSNKGKLLELANTPLNEICSAVILKKLPKKLGDPGKFLIPTTSSSSSPNLLLEEFADELALITFLPRNNDLPFDIESNLKEIEYLLHHDPIKNMDSILKDSVDEDNLADLNDNLVDTMPEMFTDKHALDYSSPSIYDDDPFEVESNTEYVYDDPFDSKGEKIKESKLVIDELDLPSNFLPSSEYDSILSEDFSEVDALPSTNNEDKDFDPPLYELPFFKKVPDAETPLSFSFENEKKVFKPRILTSKGVHSSLIPELSQQGYKVFKIIKILKSSMEIFIFSHGEDIHILDVPCLYFYPP
nr:hypothetical protein [Tanacetum cinerariifolium]